MTTPPSFNGSQQEGKDMSLTHVDDASSFLFFFCVHNSLVGVGTSPLIEVVDSPSTGHGEIPVLESVDSQKCFYTRACLPFNARRHR